MKTWQLFEKSLLAAGALTLATACGAPGEEPSADTGWEATLTSEEQGLLAACDPVELGEVAEHACVHAELGPFAPVTAAALNAPVLVDVSLPHTAYNVTLPSTGFCGWGGRVGFIPDESSEFAFLLSRHRGVRIFDAATGAEVARECRYNVPSSVCGDLKTAIVADLEGGAEYYLQFLAIAERNSEFTLVIEETAHDHSEE
ncbi:hypothetical protein JY651_45855 [Pyxidicoccus parkwayensis]|uniref:Lipoprotein n=1 Tax=Pyxidicoccus parkwayensis TaxID=2813578 RepID=A0ABX7NVE0_9BACT|nr:hypothetical protein [Pyxidicoccus parkwaysis]QSQ22371.1 hypothetical protein JY651_45855 [Pyxidicoccus parkwaysis]